MTTSANVSASLQPELGANHSVNGCSASLKYIYKSHIAILYGTGILTFWVVRLYYWHITYELPFSDMADYVHLGQRVAAHFDFRWDPFWIAFKPPTFPLLLAINFKLFGSDNLLSWRFCQTILLFSSLLWLCREITISTNRHYFGIALLWIVALSKSSIFWSYKPAMESASEAFIYLMIAASMFALRRQKPYLFLLLGFIYAAGVMLRPQFLLVTALLCGTLLLHGAYDRTSWRKLTLSLFCFVLGGLITWAPWVMRNYRDYGHLVLLTTQEPYTFLWDVGAVTIIDTDGKPITRDAFQLLAQAPTRFRNDDDAAKFANRFVREWLREKRSELPAIVWSRAVSTITTPASNSPSGLTHVSRRQILPGRYNRLLIDKSPVLLVTGIAGLIAFVFLAPMTLNPVAIVPIGQWVLGFSLSSYARLLEPSVPLFLFGNVMWVVLILGLIRAQPVVGVALPIRRTG
jgi:hypothetical protein